MSDALLQQTVLILAASLLGALAFRRLRITPIVAYMAVGAVLGPSVLGLVDDPARFSLIAEFGVVFLLFALGLEFSLPRMLQMRFAVFGVGAAQVGASTVLFALAVWFWGVSPGPAVVIAGALSLSSTAIVTRELLANRALQSEPGRLSIGVLLFQDLVAVVFLILVPVLAGADGANVWVELGRAGLSAAVLLIVLLAVGKWVLPVIYMEVAKSRSDEIFVLTTLVIVLLASWLTHAFHLSMSLGAFVTGMMLAEGSCKYQIESDIRPFKDILLGLFFVTIGMNLNVDLLLQFAPRILLFTALLMGFKAAVVTVLVRLLGFSLRDGIVTGVNLAQAGEFGLALLALALVNGVLPADQASFIILIATLSMAVSPFLMRYADSLAQRLQGDATPEPTTRIQLDLSDHVIIGGFGRLGSTLANFLDRNGVPWIAVEADIGIVERERRQGRNIVFGDSHNIEILARCHLDRARLVVLTFRSMAEGRAVIGRIRERSPNLPIVVRCQDHGHYGELVALGATHVFPEVLESSLLISRQVLELLQVPVTEVDAQVGDFLASLPARK